MKGAGYFRLGKGGYLYFRCEETLEKPSLLPEKGGRISLTMVGVKSLFFVREGAFFLPPEETWRSFPSLLASRRAGSARFSFSSKRANPNTLDQLSQSGEKKGGHRPSTGRRKLTSIFQVRGETAPSSSLRMKFIEKRPRKNNSWRRGHPHRKGASLIWSREGGKGREKWSVSDKLKKKGKSHPTKLGERRGQEGGPFFRKERKLYENPSLLGEKGKPADCPSCGEEKKSHPRKGWRKTLNQENCNTSRRVRKDNEAIAAEEGKGGGRDAFFAQKGHPQGENSLPLLGEKRGFLLQKENGERKNTDFLHYGEKKKDIVTLIFHYLKEKKNRERNSTFPLSMCKGGREKNQIHYIKIFQTEKKRIE